MAISCSNIDTLPEDCVSKILTYTSPLDACNFSMVSSTLHSAANSDTLWRSFLPSDYEDIISRTLNPLTLQSSSSYRHLFFSLCQQPLLLDRGHISFKLDKYSGKKTYILSARELSITWSNDPLYWSWRPSPESRFAEVAEVRTVSWLEIKGKMRTHILTPNTTYVVYLITKVSHRVYGLDSAPAEVSVAMANKVQNGMAYLYNKYEDTMFYENHRKMERNKLMEDNKEIRVPSKRDDGWMEIELGEFFCGEVDMEVKMSVMEVGYRLKGGLIVEGIEVRPK
ncbi:putative phloem protein [Medicago truncatula]|uniref:F-box protein n=2 Tax=Medicago truncatula TaxID=3880 RepID=G7I8S6_MEDTR|nr:F-box protein PP2-B15 [Medicago truncatula]AES61426.1 F-box protein [Medicago truncatula]RHN80820.1 putative phloem protein [Medicago truncatula]